MLVAVSKGARNWKPHFGPKCSACNLTAHSDKISVRVLLSEETCLKSEPIEAWREVSTCTVQALRHTGLC
jgi:hypothetical protein